MYFVFVVNNYACYYLQICDMVAIARYMNVTLIVPELDKTSFWADPRYCHSIIRNNYVLHLPSKVGILRFNVKCPLLLTANFKISLM